MIRLGPTEPLTLSEHAKRMRKARIGLSVTCVAMIVFLAAITCYVITVETSLSSCQ